MNPLEPMKTKMLYKLVALAALASAVTAQAGPPPEFFRRLTPKTVAQTAQAVIATNVAKEKMACAACKTVKLREPRYRAPMGKGMPDMVEVGAKHKCTKCDGSITNFKGKITDNMQVTCPTCLEAGCCVPPAAAPQ